ncbi:MAG: helix-turn-helix transcriptional regulator [Chthoniobacteraceae bacterium]
MASKPASLNVCGRELVRIRGDISQEQLAAKCQLAGWDVSRAIIANIELGRRILTDGELAILARVLRAPLEEFYPREIRARLPKR